MIYNAEFVMSNSDVRKCPDGNVPEYAFIGRSNVGKSSLINMLCNHKNLAKTSSKPGKTLLINHFLVNKSWHLVDLPGYGYAVASKTMRDKLRKIIDSYILKREQMINLFVLIDSRHTPQKIDLEFMEWLGENGVPFAIIFTKIDKLNYQKQVENIRKYTEILSETWEELPPYFLTSSEKKIGRDEVLEYIDSINKTIEEERIVVEKDESEV